uniref:Uncharacterized protein n=1 Tax=Romanomermis culicivorax TaxID=13658 RepID=A0A915JXC0_ROMCU
MEQRHSLGQVGRFNEITVKHFLDMMLYNWSLFHCGMVVVTGYWFCCAGVDPDSQFICELWCSKDLSSTAGSWSVKLQSEAVVAMWKSSKVATDSSLCLAAAKRSDCRNIFRLNFWFILDMKHAPGNMGGPWKLVETMFNKMTDRTEYFPNLREYTFSVSYGTPGTKVPDFYTISPCNTTQCLRQAIQSHIAYKSSTKTSNVYSSFEAMYLRGPVNGQQGRGLREFIMLGTKVLLVLFSTGSRLHDTGVNYWEAMKSFLPIRGLVSIRIDNDPDSRALIGKHEIMKDFYHFHVNANFKPNDDAKEVTRALKTFRDESIKGGQEMCYEVNYCQYSGRVGPCIRLQNGTCFKYADIQLKGGVLCLKKGYNLCQYFEPCGYATTTTLRRAITTTLPRPITTTLPRPIATNLLHAITTTLPGAITTTLPLALTPKHEEEGRTIVAAKLAAPVSTTVAPGSVAGIFGISEAFYKKQTIGFMFHPIHGFRNWPLLLSLGRDRHIYRGIGWWWDLFGATQEAFQQSRARSNLFMYIIYHTAAGAPKSGKKDSKQRTAAVQASMVLTESEGSKSTARTGGTPGAVTPPVKKKSIVKKTSKTKAASVTPSKGKMRIRA